MKKLRMKCHLAEIIFATNSEKIYNYFLTDEEQVPETIPGIEIIPDQNVGLDGNYLIYLDKSPNLVQINPDLNQALICVPESELYLPDLIYLALSMFAKELNKEDKYFIHCAIVEKDGKATLISGEPGSGKTTLAMYLCMEKGYNFVCNDRAIIGIENGIPYIYCGTLQTHIRVGVIHEYFPSLVNKIDKEKMEKPWENKIYINPEFDELGIKVNKTSKLSNILFTSTYPVKDEETNLTEQREDVATLATMKVVSEYIRADRNIVLSTDYPFPNFDNQELAMKRMNFVKKLVEETKIYTARGNIKKLSDMIDEKLY